jgi:hypothetical protein
MNKQEALVALLEVVRKWERTDSEVRRDDVEVRSVFSALGEAARELETVLASVPSRRSSVQVRQRLITLGAAAVWLLVDEVEVVEGKALDEWLAEKAEPVAGVREAVNGSMRVHGTPGAMIVEKTSYVPVVVPRPSITTYDHGRAVYDAFAGPVRDA